MSEPFTRPRRRARPRRSPARRALKPALLLVGVAVLFAAGLAVGQATNDNPDPGTTQTLVRTLAPGTVAPVPETVTVTVTTP